MDSTELFLFHSSSTEDLAALHPQPVHIFRLWQIYLDSINPVFKLFHTPTVQQRILDVSADPQNASNSMHVLMFGIYTMAVTSLTDENCLSYFGEGRDDLIKKYQNAAKLALVQARFMRSSDMTTLQGFMLHLVSNNFVPLHCFLYLREQLWPKATTDRVNFIICCCPKFHNSVCSLPNPKYS
jgi:hypothetical protein